MKWTLKCFFPHSYLAIRVGRAVALRGVAVSPPPPPLPPAALSSASPPPAASRLLDILLSSSFSLFSNRFRRHSGRAMNPKNAEEGFSHDEQKQTEKCLSGVKVQHRSEDR